MLKRSGNSRKAGWIKALVVLVPWLIVLGTTAYAQNAAPADPWASWRFLVGDWVGIQADGSESGAFSFAFDLNENILVRKNHLDIPASKDRPGGTHDDLMIVYRPAPNDTRAIYFDNEGHAINYAASFSKTGDSLMFVSDIMPQAPRFRLTYIKTGTAKLTITFEIAPPGKPEGFTPYLSGAARKK